jgi:hypothetical protein
MLKFTTLAFLGAIAASTLAACSGPENDGRYATHDRGRSNNRAAVPADAAVLMAEIGL